MSLLTTASQTVGPFVTIGFSPMTASDLTVNGVSGERITLRGRVLDGDGNPVSDAVIETWQANSQGKYAHPEDFKEKLLDPDFKGFGRLLSNEKGEFRLTTIKPGSVPGPGGSLQAPHLVVVVFMRGLLKHLLTRVYFPGEPSNAADPVLKLVPAERRATLIAKPLTSGGELEWNVILQGSDETVFFEY